MTEDIILTGEETPFFAPAPTDLIDNLLAQYEAMRMKVERVADVMNGPDLAGALHYFAEHAGSQERHLSSSTVESLFNLEGAIAHLNASFWSKAMQLTDVLDVMPQARRDEWHAQIRNPLGEKKDRYSKEWSVQPIPEFNDENVRGTLLALLAQRETFFAERVDGIFRSLSKTHVTNAPEGFNRRMILANVTDSWGTYTTSRAGTINDLRCVIAKFMGREEPGWDATGGIIKYARRRRGEWISVDGGAIRIRCYAVGTAHLEVHPDMAWRLNCVLAQLYPQAIPSQFRERPKKKAREYKLIGRPLPFAVLALLGSLEEARDLNPDRHQYRADVYTKVPGCYDLRSHAASEQVRAEVDRVLQALGGAPVACVLGNRYAFDYDPREVVQEIVASGCIPDAKSHQFYPTPAALAQRVIELAEIGPGHTCLEPSAGLGGLADLMPRDRTACVEISALHCKALEAKGYSVTQADFLALHTNRKLYDRVVMNPPFSEGRWQAHLQHAAGMVAPGGRLVAILPSSAKRSTELPGFDCEWMGPLENQFPGVSVDVVILVADRGVA